MDDAHLGRCAHCGRPRTTTPSGAPVSCCPRAVVAPKTTREAESMVGGVADFLDRALLRAPRGLPRVGCGVVVLVTLLAVALGAALVIVALR